MDTTLPSSEPPHHLFNDIIYSVDNISDDNAKTISNYADIIFHNDGYHLHRGTGDAKHLQHCWETSTSLPIKWYYLLAVVFRRCFLDILTALMTGIFERRWNSEWMIVFLIITLQLNKGVSSAKDICYQIQNRMEPWDIGDTETTNREKQLSL